MENQTTGNLEQFIADYTKKIQEEVDLENETKGFEIDYSTSNLSTAWDYSEFFQYIWDFYGADDALYPIRFLKKQDIVKATEIYLEECDNSRNKKSNWLDGDSIDRENVAGILVEKFGYTINFDEVRNQFEKEVQ